MQVQYVLTAVCILIIYEWTNLPNLNRDHFQFSSCVLSFKSGWYTIGIFLSFLVYSKKFSMLSELQVSRQREKSAFDFWWFYADAETCNEMAFTRQNTLIGSLRSFTHNKG